MSVESLFTSNQEPCCDCLVNWQLSCCETMLSLVPVVGFVWAFRECICAQNKEEELDKRQVNYHFSKEMKDFYQNDPELVLEEEVIEYKSLEAKERSAKIRQINLVFIMTINAAVVLAGCAALDIYVVHLVN